MSTTATDDQDTEQCKAITEDGERCSRPAQDDGFCYQHDESDETVDDADEGTQDDADDAEESADDAEESADEPADEEHADGAADDGATGESEAVAEQEEGQGHEEGHEQRAEQSEEQGQDDSMSSSEIEAAEAETGIVEVRERVQNLAGDVVGHPLDGITSVDKTDEGWRVAVEVVERKGVPDTQDILGRYEIRMDDDLNVGGYQRTHRYRRDDMDHDI